MRGPLPTLTVTALVECPHGGNAGSHRIDQVNRTGLVSGNRRDQPTSDAGGKAGGITHHSSRVVLSPSTLDDLGVEYQPVHCAAIRVKGGGRGRALVEESSCRVKGHDHVGRGREPVDIRIDLQLRGDVLGSEFPGESARDLDG